MAVRSLRRSKGFAAAAILTLALGIAVTTTIFSVVYGVLLRPLPYADAGRLVVIQGEKAYSTGPRIMNFSGPELEPFAANVRAFSAVALTSLHALTFKGSAGVESLSAATVSDRFFATLGVAPIAGRVLDSSDAPEVVISERLWRRLFNGDPKLSGRTLRLADSDNVDRLYTVVGVMPAAFQLPRPRTDVWRGLTFSRAAGVQRSVRPNQGGHEFIARLGDGVPFDTARADAETVVATVLKPGFATSRLDMYAKVSPLIDTITASVRPALWTLMGTITLLMLVACANVANLLLVRHAARSREICVHLALGAPRARLLAYLLTEAGLIAVMSTSLGVLTAFGCVRILRWLQPSTLPRLDAVAIDLPVIAFATAAAVLALLLAGFIPAWIATRPDAMIAVRLGGRSSGQAGISGRVRSLLTVAELATTVVLLIGAMLLSRSLLALMHADVGVNTENVIAANIDMSMGRVTSPERQAQLARDLEERIGALPGVRSAGVGSGVPPAGELMRVSFILNTGASADSHMVTTVPASPGYFSTLQIRLIAGRLFTRSDAAAAAPVAILSREAARRLFGADDPIGRQLPLIGKQWTVVGVVDNVKYTGLASGPDPVLYLPFEQSPMRVSVVLARTTGDASAFAAQLRGIIRSYDAGISVPRLETLQWLISDAVSQPRLRAALFSTIALVTLLLAMVGLYGVIAYSTAQRTTEIGVRMAIGAQRADVIRMVLAEGARLAAAGTVLGLALAWWAARLLASFLYGVTATDPASFAGAAACLVIVALGATVLPASRAARIDPSAALRAE